MINTRFNVLMKYFFLYYFVLLIYCKKTSIPVEFHEDRNRSINFDVLKTNYFASIFINNFLN